MNTIKVHKEMLYQDFFMETTYWVQDWHWHYMLVLPLLCFHLCHACHYLYLLWNNYEKIMSKICLHGCLKICDIPRNAFWCSDNPISYRFPNRYYTNTNHSSFQTDTDIPFILHFKPIPIPITHMSYRYRYRYRYRYDRF